ncbi:hypothetical protein EVAR_35581_1 [Eumeta japonica]|uniref:Uncharacterized protein n=1 Tax=Eumeta variegata TaxID=151549 RepID=A0A4C1XMF5_EUMVA|nr:hypothetical protein EVAR_35581_1 [Eumeta japonica]
MAPMSRRWSEVISRDRAHTIEQRRWTYWREHSSSGAIQRTQLCRCEVSHESVAIAERWNAGEKKGGSGSAIAAQCIIHSQFRAVEFRMYGEIIRTEARSVRKMGQRFDIFLLQKAVCFMGGVRARVVVTQDNATFRVVCTTLPESAHMSHVGHNFSAQQRRLRALPLFLADPKIRRRERHSLVGTLYTSASSCGSAGIVVECTTFIYLLSSFTSTDRAVRHDIHPALIFLNLLLSHFSDPVQHNARNSAAVKSVTKASHSREIGTRRVEGRVGERRTCAMRRFGAEEFRALYCTPSLNWDLDSVLDFDVGHDPYAGSVFD